MLICQSSDQDYFARWANGSIYIEFFADLNFLIFAYDQATSPWGFIQGEKSSDDMVNETVLHLSGGLNLMKRETEG